MIRIKIISTLLLMGAGQLAYSQQVAIQIFKPDTSTSIRAIAVPNDSTVWFGGSKGKYGFTIDNDNSWTVIQKGNDLRNAEFRSIAALPSGAVFMTNIGSPGYILQLSDDGFNWQQRYKNEAKDQFFDALVFVSDEVGYALGDPLSGCIQLLKTNDAGKNWNPINCNDLPALDSGEAFFASSNTSMDALGKHIWIATGGPKARVVYSGDNGASWKLFKTPIQQGSKMTGIFSLDMYNEKIGVVAGGDYDNKAETKNTIAFTKDGGRTWKVKANQLPFVSCVQFIPGSKGKKLLAACLPGVYYSNNAGLTWLKISDESFYTLRITPSGKIAWFAGAKGLIGKMNLTDIGANN
ncbi:oxidoreductase [Solitalea longa]|uniref:Oxidoreductase n=1 Tax=Solitalea longa TaxID=2079460 RepID=A0A2S5A3Y0_9SPHI|nr:oxidoreductase [Solitalea longa]POY37017.1 oxidoreductase [Solitalea longa]